MLYKHIHDVRLQTGDFYVLLGHEGSAKDCSQYARDFRKWCIKNEIELFGISGITPIWDNDWHPGVKKKFRVHFAFAEQQDASVFILMGGTNDDKETVEPLTCWSSRLRFRMYASLTE